MIVDSKASPTVETVDGQRPSPRLVSLVSGWPIAILALLVSAAFAPLFVRYWSEWTAEHSPFGYGYFVPPTVAFYIWAMREKLRKAEFGEAGIWAWALLALGSAAEWLALFAGVTLLQAVALLAILLSLTAILWGPARARIVAPALIYLATMVPWPGQFMSGIFFQLQRTSIVLATILLRLAHLGPITNGPTIYLDHYSFEVAPACAGLTIVFPTVACMIFTVMMINAAAWRKMLLVAISVPVCILINGLRIAAIGVIGNQGGTDLAARLHDMSGWVGVVICVLLLGWIGSWFGCANYKPEFIPKWAVAPRERA